MQFHSLVARSVLTSQKQIILKKEYLYSAFTFEAFNTIDILVWNSNKAFSDKMFARVTLCVKMSSVLGIKLNIHLSEL